MSFFIEFEMRIIFIIILFASYVNGQDTAQNETITPKQIENNILPEQLNQNTVLLPGSNLKQVSIGYTNADVNSANISNSAQLGSYNYLSLNQSGIGINSTILQLGNGNSYEGNLQGNDINSFILQRGSMQYINQSATGNRLEYSIIQEGINNKIYQYENNSTLTNYQIKQIGINMQLIIINGKPH